MLREKADETVTVRMPRGTANRLRALTGQPFSRLVRWTMLAFLEKYEHGEEPQKLLPPKPSARTMADIAATVKDLHDPS